jgi:chemotaxis protein methyltransferase CheR
MDQMTIAAIADLVERRSRLSFAGRKTEQLRRRVLERMAVLGVDDPQAYRSRLQRDEGEEAALLDLLTTNETFFFRNPRQFDYLMERIVPRLESERGEQVMQGWGTHGIFSPESRMKLRIFCAGCSTGEEPYSLAMALLRTIRYPRAWDIRICAVDLSRACLESAERGWYGDHRLRSLAPEFRRRYLEPCGEGMTVTEEVRRMVSFAPYNLGRMLDGEPLPFGGEETFDLIFCRNVMIYFSFESQQELVAALSRRLHPGGYLFTGDGEPLHLYRHDLQAVDEAGCLIYRKAGGKDAHDQ